MTMRGWDESFKRPGAIPFKWEIQPGVPKQAAAAAADTSTAGHQKLQPPPARARLRSPARFVRSAPVSPAKSRPFTARSASPSPAGKPPAAAVTSHGCFPAGAPLKRRDRKATKAPHPQAAAPTRRSSSAFSAPLGRAAAPVEGAPRRARAFTGPLSKSGSPSAAAEDAWARRASLRRSSSACFSPLDGHVPTAEEAVSASRWLF